MANAGAILGGAASGAAAGTAFGPWGTAIGGVVGGIGGWLSSDADEAALRDQQSMTQEQRDQYMSLFQGSISGARDRLGNRESQAQIDLQQLLQGEAGLAQRSIADTMKQGRRQAAASGLIGGGQEAGLINPAIERTLANLAQVGTKAQLDFQSLFGGMSADIDKTEATGITSLNKY